MWKLINIEYHYKKIQQSDIKLARLEKNINIIQLSHVWNL
jgi:hypothetical protein